MAASTANQGQTSAFALHPEDEEDDNLSLNSTPPPPDDEEYPVEDIRAEKLSTNIDGKQIKKYLVEWEGFPFDECTWEDEENLSTSLRNIWARNLDEITAGMREPYAKDIERFKAAKVERRRKTIIRKEKRNAKRVRLGLKPLRIEFNWDSDFDDEPDRLPQPSPVPYDGGTDSETGSDLVDTSSSSDEALDTNVGKAPPPPKPPTPPRRSQTKGIARPVNSKASTASQSSRPSTAENSAGRIGPARKLSKDKVSTVPASRSKKTTGTGMTARKTKTCGNIFVDGKKTNPKSRRDSRSLEKKKDPQQYRCLKSRRRAELASRDRENSAPPITELHPDSLFDPSTGPKTVPPPKVTAVKSSAGAPSEHRMAMSGANAVFAPSALASSTPGPSPPAPSPSALAPSLSGTGAEMTALGGPGPTKKKPKSVRKSVRFEDDTAQADNGSGPDPAVDFCAGGVVVAEPEDMDVDVEPPVLASDAAPNLAQVPRRVLSLDQYRQERSSLRTVTKAVTFGCGKTPFGVEASFTGVPQSTGHPWLAAFQSEERVLFGHVCLAESFKRYLDDFIGPPGSVLCRGTVYSASTGADGQKLMAVADYLKSTGSGLFHSSETYNMLMYPATSDDWKNLDHLGPDTPTNTGEPAILKHLCFHSSVAIRPFLNWEPNPSIALGDEQWQSTRVRLMKNMFGLGTSAYRRLIPPRSLEPPAAHRFFLLFPSLTRDLVFQVTVWIRACNAQSEVYFTEVPGSWMEFLAKTDAGTASDASILIVHESAMWLLRRIPRLREFLANSRQHVVWCWPDKSTPPPTLMPSVEREDGTTSGSFHIEPVRLFPHGHCFLLTPSFLVAEPRHALALCNHLLNAKPPPPGKTSPFWRTVLVASNIVQFLHDLAAEKLSQRQVIIEGSGYASAAERERVANARGLSMEDCRSRLELAVLFHEMIGPKYEEFPEQNYSQPIYFADEAIDPSDEQSLVNWFGWWSIAHADQYRKFHVVLAKTDLGKPAARPFHDYRATRSRLKIPRFRADTVNDPDALLLVREREAAKERQATPKPNQQQITVPQQRQPDSSCEAVPAFRSDLLQSDHSGEINWYLGELQKKRIPGPYRLYGFPVFWKDVAEASRHAVLDLKGLSIQAWFDYTYGFKFDRKREYVLYMGFFYTVDDGWNRESRVAMGRRPWVLLWRYKTEENTELVILDPSLSPRLPGPPGRMQDADLRSAQRAAIQHVRANQHRKNPPRKLSQVWVGQVPSVYRGSPFDQRYRSPFDQCLRVIEALTHNGNVIPLGDLDMERQGFLRVTPTPDPASLDANRMDLDGCPGASGGRLDNAADEVDDIDAAVIFHPPRGSRVKLGVVQSKCVNNLYEAARKAKSLDRRAETMEYNYVPTMQWYGQQEVEGRGFGHISFAGWDETAKAAGISSHPGGGEAQAQSPSD